MDQNSTNGSGPDKRNWRERLGIGAKEMPKLSDEFRDGSVKAQPGGSSAAQAPRGAQPVTKPAPMAPRAPRPSAGDSSESAAPPSAAPMPASRATPRVPDNATQDALAEKLRAQRAAAERLAEQRVQAARDRAEGKVPPPPEPPRAPAGAAPRMPPPPSASKPRAPVPPPPPGRPKFSFAEEPATGRAPADAPAGRPGLGSGAPLNPPRPALGGERGQPPFLRPTAPAPGIGSRPQTPYRPVDQSANYGAPPRLQPPPARGGAYGGEAPAGYGAPRSAPRRPPALESFPRQPEPRDYADAEQDDGRQVPRLGRPARGRSPQDDFDEVFEDDGVSRQRPGARDYQSAYGESEDAFADDQRRSSGPWLLLLALLAAALITGGVVWYYNSGMNNVAGTGETTGDVPVVSAPPEPPKVEPEPSAGGAEQPAAQRKLIYDRIVGEQEVLGGGQVQPTEEIPVEPASAGASPSDVPAVPEGNPIPAPDAQMQGTETDGLPTVDEPPPLPLPPAGEQGSLGTGSGQRIAATSAEVEQGATAPPAPPSPSVPAPSTAPSTSSVALLPPPPETATDGAALVSEAAANAEPAATRMEPEPSSGSGTETVEAETPPPPKKKPVAKKPKPPEENMENLGAEPVVLVPPAQPVSDETQTASNTPVAPAVEAAPPAEKKPRSIMDLFRNATGNDEEAAPAETQLAAVEQEKPARPARRQQQQQQQQEQPQPETQAQQPVTGSGFVVQLASFRSESEARKEYGRLSNLYPDVVGGLQQQIRQTSVGGSTRYQLGLGPLPSRSDATRVCSALITAGESDCIVRGR